MEKAPGKPPATGTDFTLELADLIAKIPERETCSEGSVIFSEGDPADRMYLILSGQVRLTMKGEPMAMEQAGGFIGEMALIDQRRRNATATALTDCELAPLSKDEFLELLQSRPQFALRVMAVLADRLRLANDILASV